MGLRERVPASGGVPTTEYRRGNVLLAGALMLAALVVVVALSLTLAPTGSDGVTGESADHGEFDVVEEGLAHVFVESHDTLDPAYDPTFEAPATDPPPIDYDSVATLLESEPFTDEQVVQTQSLLSSLAHRSAGGDIAPLEPIASETRTGTLVRAGTDQAHGFGPGKTTLVENATAVQDVEFVLERATLPTTPDNATTVTVGEWTLAAHQNVTGQRIHYQVGTHDPDSDWQTTDENASRLHVNAYEETVNGDPAEGLDIDPGETPFAVVVDGGSPGESAGAPHGGFTLVAGGATPADVGDVPDNRFREVVTRPAFNATYIDATTTLTTRVTADTEYRAFEYAGEGGEPVLLDVSLAVDTENPDELAGVEPEAEVWLPDYEFEDTLYGATVEMTYSNGTTVTASEAEFALYEHTDDGLTQCAGDGVEDTCGAVSTSPVFDGAQISPDALHDSLLVAAEVPESIGNESVSPSGTVPATSDTTTVVRNVTVLDPYTGATLHAPAEVAVGDSVEGVSLSLVPRKQGFSNRTIPAADLAALDSPGPTQVITEVGHRFDVDGDDTAVVAEAFARLGELNATQQAAFLGADASDRVEMLGFDRPCLIA